MLIVKKLGFGFGKYVFNGARTFNTHRVDSIRKLRDLTGSPITECKKALEDSNYELESAILLLQKHGKTIVDHKASIMINYWITILNMLEIATEEGLVCLHKNANFITSLILRSQTDFITKTQDFQRTLLELSKIFIRYETGLDF